MPTEPTLLTLRVHLLRHEPGETLDGATATIGLHADMASAVREACDHRALSTTFLVRALPVALNRSVKGAAQFFDAADKADKEAGRRRRPRSHGARGVGAVAGEVRDGVVMETRAFPTWALASITTGKLLGDFGTMHEAIGFILGRPVWTHELASAVLIAGLRDTILTLRPELRDADACTSCAAEMAPGKATDWTWAATGADGLCDGCRAQAAEPLTQGAP